MLRILYAALASLSVITSSMYSFADDGVYELRVYTCEPGKIDALHSRFKDHTMRIFEKHGMKNIAYWIPSDTEANATESSDSEDNKDRLIYIIRHESRDAAAASWKAFIADPEWKAVAKASREAHGKILSKSPESTYMTLTDYSPKIGKADPNKTYELRTYVTEPGRLDALNARFRDHTMKIFSRHGLKSFGYWTPQDEPASKNTLIYVLEYENRDAAKAGWKKFGADPEWKKARAASEKDGKILSQRPASLYMVPTGYTPE